MSKVVKIWYEVSINGWMVVIRDSNNVEYYEYYEDEDIAYSMVQAYKDKYKL